MIFDAWPVLGVACLVLVIVLVALAQPESDTFIDDRCGDGAIEDEWGLDALAAAARDSAGSTERADVRRDAESPARPGRSGHGRRRTPRAA